MSKPKVIVIGAGVSGLSAARRLTEKGDSEVLILEGRSRIGGRVETIAFADTYVDTGAMFLEGDGKDNPVMPILDEMGVKMHHHFDLGEDMPKLVEAAGPTGDATAVGDVALTELYWLQTPLEAIPKALDDEAAKRRKKYKEMGDITLKQGADANGLNEQGERQKEIIESFMSVMYAGTGLDLDQASLTWSNFSPTTYDGCEVSGPIGGWAQFTDHLSKGLEIKVDSKVTAVRATDEGAEVELASGEKMPCKAVICTLPIGVLKAGAVAFEPPLPEPKLAAIKSMGVGHTNRIAVRFDKCFWSEEKLYNRIITDKKRRTAAGKEMPLWWNWHSYSKANVLIAVSVGETAVEMEKLTDQEASAWVKKLLTSMFDKRKVETAKILELSVSRWSGDEFSLGALPSSIVGSTPDDFDAISEPHGPVFFAGDATFKARPGCVDGAFSSGLVAAKQVTTALFGGGDDFGPQDPVVEAIRKEGRRKVMKAPWSTVKAPTMSPGA